MMMNKISVGYGRTFKTGDYESIRLDCTLEAVVEDDDDPGTVRADLQRMAREGVRDEYRAYQQAQIAKKGGAVLPPPTDAAFREKVKAAEQDPGIVKEPAQGGAGTAEVKSGTGPVTGDIAKDGY